MNIDLTVNGNAIIITPSAHIELAISQQIDCDNWDNSNKISILNAQRSSYIMHSYNAYNAAIRFKHKHNTLEKKETEFKNIRKKK